MKRLALLAALTLLGCGGSTSTAEPSTGTETSGGQTSGTDSSSDDTSSTETSSTDARPTADASATTDASGPSADLADYARRTMAIVRRHWTIPAALAAPETMRLEASIEITIDETTRRATGYRILRVSGNADLDASVMRGLQALVDANETMPEPPVGLDDRASVRLRLTNHR